AIGGQAKLIKAKEVEAPFREVAVKYVHGLPGSIVNGKPSLWERFNQEARMWHTFGECPYVVPLYNTFKQRVLQAPDGELVFLGFITPYAELGDLSQWLRPSEGTTTGLSS